MYASTDRVIPPAFAHRPARARPDHPVTPQTGGSTTPQTTPKPRDDGPRTTIDHPDTPQWRPPRKHGESHPAAAPPTFAPRSRLPIRPGRATLGARLTGTVRGCPGPVRRRYRRTVQSPVSRLLKLLPTLNVAISQTPETQTPTFNLPSNLQQCPQLKGERGD